jgi:murein DD-endopeptidase MepM/ murein hydrolase activator NlpD
LHRNKAHLGTDFAAPYGTPILATAAGSVIEAGYRGGNGNYVKIKHNKTYTTQYLHMSRFATGIRRGAAVKQGQVIGYVGSTGLATGPHVCYRFWKNGKQVDPIREKNFNLNPVSKKNKAAFELVKKEWTEKLNRTVDDKLAARASEVKEHGT